MILVLETFASLPYAMLFIIAFSIGHLWHATATDLSHHSILHIDNNLNIQKSSSSLLPTQLLQITSQQHKVLHPIIRQEEKGQEEQHHIISQPFIGGTTTLYTTMGFVDTIRSWKLTTTPNVYAFVGAILSIVLLIAVFVFIIYILCKKRNTKIALRRLDLLEAKELDFNLDVDGDEFNRQSHIHQNKPAIARAEQPTQKQIDKNPALPDLPEPNNEIIHVQQSV